MDQGRSGISGDTVVDPALIQVRELLREVRERPGFAWSDNDILANVRQIRALLSATEATYLTLLHELKSRPDAVPGARVGQTAQTFLTEALRVAPHQAKRDVAAAAAIASASPDLPLMGQALADGEVSRDHLDVAVSTLKRTPKAIRTKLVEEPITQLGETPTPTPTQPAEPVQWEVRPGAQVIDELLTKQAKELAPTTVDKLGRLLVEILDPDRAEKFDADAYERRTCTVIRDFAGMFLYRLILDPATGAEIEAVLARRAKPLPAGEGMDEDGNTVQVRDTRPAGQRRADALVDLILGGDTVTPDLTTEPQPDPEPEAEPEDAPEPEGDPDPDGPAGEPDDESTPPAPAPAPAPMPPPQRAPASAATEVSVIATLEQFMAAFGADDPTAGYAHLSLAGKIGDYPGSTLAPQVLARLACDSPIRRILIAPNGAVLHHGRAERLATPAQRRALAVRDHGCVVPGCPMPAEWCQAHHIVPWKDGGRTDIDAMALLCPRHHTAHHAGIYDLTIRDGIVWARLPGWIDITRPWLRNTTRRHEHNTRHIAQKLTRPTD